MKIPAFITVRTASTRLPKKCLLPFGEGTVLDHIIKRCIHFNLRPIVCTTNLPSDEIIVNIARFHKIEFFRGESINKLMRWRDCSRQYEIPYFHTVDADDPFFCGDEVKRSIKFMLDGRYEMVAPTKSSSKGGATVGYSLQSSVVERACIDTKTDTDTEMMWSHISKVDELKSANLIEPESDIIDCRLTLDYHEDFVLLDAIRILLGPLASRADICELLKNNPSLPMINAFRNEEWAAIQKKKAIIKN